MAKLANYSVIDSVIVCDEIARLQVTWVNPDSNTNDTTLTAIQSQIPDVDLFEQLQLNEVLKVCRKSRTLSDAGRRLFSTSRQEKKQANDADRLRKYLAKHGLTWQASSQISEKTFKQIV
jgi:transcriptional regulatory protein RtcR